MHFFSKIVLGLMVATAIAAPSTPPSESKCEVDVEKPFTFSKAAQGTYDLISSMIIDDDGDIHIADDGVARSYAANGTVIDYRKLSHGQLLSMTGALPPRLQDKSDYFANVFAKVSGLDVDDEDQIWNPSGHLHGPSLPDVADHDGDADSSAGQSVNPHSKRQTFYPAFASPFPGSMATLTNKGIFYTEELSSGIRAVQVLGLTATAFFCGKTYSQSFSTTPALLQAPAPLLARQWKTMFDSDKALSPAVVALGSGIFTYLASRESISSRHFVLYTTSATLLLTCIPYTFIVGEPINQKLEKKAKELGSTSLTDAAAEAGVAQEETVHQLVDRWATMNLEAEDESFITSAYEDPASRLNVTPFLAIPQPKKQVKDTIDWFQNKCMLGVVICLPAAPPSNNQEMASNTVTATDTSRLVPIGTIGLTALEPRMQQHRHAEIGINIARTHQNHGYGSEAIRWVLEWGFRFGNLHRIQLGAFEWNPGAIRLYERLGFVLESRKREHLWVDGRYWDLIELGMLEHEWRQRYCAEDEKAKAGAAAAGSGDVQVDVNKTGP
ncbi:hypothetical protein KC327_g15774 [Hortaea werneckii]|nr:hypothetical protein KC358_g15043 [Hortaea werneckii]KAI6804937.1 hypothetical protein KC350_g14816 [Hortaea werneckii]KAI6906792.1 hypothetical protein KC348_g14500 [Hortaea werneckii]KAI6923276.1 hypothetical protein KC341_g14845 [Hortaea werneckii]KAI6957709.1 hypothetical protein KC321_g14438 [Hortaea werneckii]